MLDTIFGGPPAWRLARYRRRLGACGKHEASFKALDDQGLARQSEVLKGRARGGEPLDRLLPEAFALVREASRRTLGMRHYDVQLLGGMALHDGCVAEMKTGEGKTLVAPLAAYLNALTGHGVHVVTVNDYLAERDSRWMGPVYELLGIKVGLILENMGDDPAAEVQARRAAYACDVTYGTNHELAFDFLRDNLATSPDEVSHRGFHFALVDEVDFLLIDEARTPLIISGPGYEDTGLFRRMDRIVRRLDPGMHYYVEEKTRTATLSDLGLERVQQELGAGSLTDPANLALYHVARQSVLAHGVYRKDVDYLVEDGQVNIVDEFTGRVSEDKRFADGLHQALEAKEGVTVRAEDRTLAKVTYQTFFGRYGKLAGMTGTAWTAKEELMKTYGLKVVRVPTHRPGLRQDFEDLVYDTADDKHRAVVEEIRQLHGEGRPVLVGSTSVEESERLDDLLVAAQIPHKVLNAKNHRQEADLIAQAGRQGAVTISTNMAGRGVDIVLGGGDEGQGAAVTSAGGLHVIGTGRHESARIDDQLRGRAGRQGDPGSSQFHVSLEDRLWRRFGTLEIDDLRRRLPMSGHVAGAPISLPGVGKVLRSLQKKVEEEDQSIRQEVLKYDLVVHVQREAMYAWRATVVEDDGFDPVELAADLAADLCQRHGEPVELERALEALFHHPFSLEGLRPVDFELAVADRAAELAEAGLERWGQAYRELGRQLLLESIDELWTDHLTALDRLEEGIGLQGYAQQDPLTAWRREASMMYGELMFLIRARFLDLWMLARPEPTDEPYRGAPTQQRTTRKG